jgi:hypothetical protein
MLSKNTCVVLTLLLVLAIAIIFIAPSVDLEPSALRAWRAAVLVFLAIIIAVQVLSGIYYSSLLKICSLCAPESSRLCCSSELSLLDLCCARLC